MKHFRVLLASSLALWLATPQSTLALPVITFANYPLFLAPAVKPNVMVIFDSSQSMDATMAGKVINGDDPATRGNIARGVLRSILATYRNSFQWGLTAFEAGGPSLYSTYPYYMGNATTLVYTNDCVAGISATNGNLRCIANPEPANGFSHITYERTGDDAIINDVLYTGWQGPQLYAVGRPATFDTYDVYRQRANTGSGYTTGDFTNYYFGGSFGATDAGFTPEVAKYDRQFFLYRGWGYLDGPTGAGRIHETVQADSSSHFNKLIALLGNETNTATGEIKNNSLFTPLAGSLKTVKDYFGGDSSPISETCQRNFVMLATDGNPTAKTNGSMYPLAQQQNVEAPPGVWTFGQAQQDVFAQLTALRSTTRGAKTYDIQTYIVGMGDSVANPSSVAALNKMADLGGGYATAFLGSNVAALTNAFQSIVGDIQSKTSAAASVALNGGSWNTGSLLYQAKFSSADWSGNLVAFQILPSGDLAATPTWESAGQVKAQNWDTARRIITYKPSAAIGARGVAFRWPAVPATPTATEIDVSQVTALNLNSTSTFDGFGDWRLKYLRGDATKEPRSCGTPPCAAPQFRNRNLTPLGDIVNSSPYYVAAPNFGYYDDMESAPYSSFVAAYRTRTPVIYVGANDGMLHAINAGTGAELFAYVPSATYSSLTQLTDLNYGHRYLVDGSPTVGDVFYGGAWHSLLVSGFRSGARGLFALDVTNPATFTESNAASIVRWEFQDPDMGYIVGQPLLVKTNNGRWSVIVNGGYNSSNANGHGFLFVIDAETGALTKKIDTGAGTAGNGLSAPAAIDTNGDGVADVVYAGDLDGKLWRFNLASSTAASWALGNAGVPVFATGGKSITGRPDVTRYSSTGGYMIGFGTGRYLATADNTDTSLQTEFGVRDTNCGCTVAQSELTQQSVVDTLTSSGKLYRRTTHAVNPPTDNVLAGDNVISRTTYDSTKKGWYMDLPAAGERSVGIPAFRGGRVIFTTIIPDVSSPCSYGGSGWLMELDALTGNRRDTPTFDTNADNYIDATDTVGGNTPSGVQNTSIATDPTIQTNGNGSGNVENKYQNTSDSTIPRTLEYAGPSGPQRVMWREVR